MKIVQIMPGFLESYYCENCLRDNSLVRTFRQLGHDVLMVPLYLPAHLDTSEPVRQTEIFFGRHQCLSPAKIFAFSQNPSLDRPNA